MIKETVSSLAVAALIPDKLSLEVPAKDGASGFISCASHYIVIVLLLLPGNIIMIVQSSQEYPASTPSTS